MTHVLAARLPHLYAVLDGAQGWGALKWLERAGLPYQCLFDGKKARELAAEAPYLLHFSNDRARLGEVVAAIWRHAGGIFVDSDRPFYAVRRQLRRFLLVKNERGKVLYFRYYDPRVAAPFLPTLDAQQIEGIFGRAIRAIIYEDDETGNLDSASISSDGVTNEGPRVRIDHLLAQA